MESLICLVYSMRRKNYVVSAKLHYNGKCMTLHTVLTDYNRQMFISIFPLEPSSVHIVHGMQNVQYLFIYMVVINGS